MIVDRPDTMAPDGRPEWRPRITRPVKLVIDSSSDGRRAAYACLIVDPPLKPRLIYGMARDVSTKNIEAWGINRAIRRTNTRYGGTRPLLVFTDNLAIVQFGRSGRVQYRWLHRDERLMQHLHNVANSLRCSMALKSAPSPLSPREKLHDVHFG